METEERAQHLPEVREIQAMIYDSIMHQKPDIISLLENHKHLLDVDIILNTKNCSCTRYFEQHPLVYNDSDEENIIKVVENIRRGHCLCENMGRLFASKRLIHLAVSTENIKLVKYLAASGCDLNVQTQSVKLTPIFLSVIKTNPVILEFLISQNVDVNLQSRRELCTPLMECVLTRKKHLAVELIKCPTVDLNLPNFRNESCLSVAVRVDDKVCVEELLVAGANPDSLDAHGFTPLMHAVRQSNEDMIKVMLKHQLDINKKSFRSETALVLAILRGDKRISKMLLEYGANPNIVTEDGFPPLLICAYEDYYDIAALLIKHGAYIDAVNQQNYTALHIAAWNGHMDTVRYVLGEGAKYDNRTVDGNTPLALACHGRCPETVMLLVEKGCNVNNSDKDQDTPLHYACYNGDLESVKLLIQHGADLNAQNRVGCTPFWNAVYNKHLDIVKFLAEANVTLEVPTVGIDQHAQTDVAITLYSEPKSPLWVALDKDSADIFFFLVMAGYNYFPEKWIYDQDFPPNASDELIALCSRFLSGPPRLQLLVRQYFRKYMRSIGEDSRTVVYRLDIPRTLRRYLLLRELM